MSSGPTLRRIAALASTAMLAAAGCGDDEESADQATSPAPTVTVTETETVPTPQTQETAPTPPGDGAEAMECGDVGFEPQTDAGAFGISATGASCDVARRVAAASERAGGRSYEAEGFGCSGAPRGGQLPTIEWVCTRDEAEITFSTS